MVIIMKNKIVIGNWEVIFVIINMVCVKVFLNFPRVAAEAGGTAGWILILYVSCIVFLIFFIISKLYSPFEGKDLIDIGEQIGGNAGRIIVGSIILTLLLYITPIILREFGENMKIISLAVSPISFVELFLIAGMIVGAYAGIEAIVRYHAISVPIIIITYLLILIAVIPYFNFSNLLPIFGKGIDAVFIKSLSKISFFSELFYLFLLAPFIKTNKNLKFVGYTAIGFSTFFLTINALVYGAVFPYPSSIEGFLPFYQLTRLINYGRFFQRIESIFVLIWGTGALLYLTTGFFFILYVFKKTFKLKYYKPIIIPFIIIVINFSLLPESLTAAIEIETKYFSNYSWIITFAMVILLLGLASLKKGVKKGSAKNE